MNLNQEINRLLSFVLKDEEIFYQNFYYAVISLE